MTRDVILKVDRLTKRFGGITAVNSVSITVKTNTIHALVGPNGAGKTTFFNLLTGFHIPTNGDVYYYGNKITGRPPEWLARRGITRSFQISAVFDTLTVKENILLSLKDSRAHSYTFWKTRRLLDLFNDEAMDILRLVNMADMANVLVSNLPYGRKRALELATVLATKPQLLLLDEPTQGMAHEDITYITDLISQIGQHCTIIMIEHNMSIIRQIADIVTVLQNGSILVTDTYDKVSEDERVRSAYLGDGFSQSA